MEVFYPKVDMKLGADENIKSISKQINKQIKEIIPTIFNGGNFSIEKYFESVLRSFGIQDITFKKEAYGINREDVTENNLETLVGKIVGKIEGRTVNSAEVEIYSFTKNNTISLPTYGSSSSSRKNFKYHYYIQNLSQQTLKKIEKKNPSYYFYDKDMNKIIYRGLPVYSIFTLYLSKKIVTDLGKELGINTDGFFSDYDITARKLIEEGFFNFDLWGNTKDGYNKILILSTQIKELFMTYLKSGYGDPYSEKCRLKKGKRKSASGERKENAKVYQTQNLKENDNTEVIMKEQVMDLIHSENIKKVIQSFKGFEIDKDTNQSKLNDFFSGYIKLLAIIQENIPSLNIYKDLLPNIFFKVRKLGQHKAAGLYYPQSKVMAVDVNYWTSVIHETGHMIHFSVADKLKEPKIIDIFTNLNMDKMGFHELNKYIKIYKGLGTICKGYRRANKIKISYDRLKQYFEKNSILGDRPFSEMVNQCRNNGEFVTIVKSIGGRYKEYYVKISEDGEGYFYVNETTLQKDAGIRTGKALLESSLGANGNPVPVDFEDFLSLKDTYDRLIKGMNGKYSLQKYITNNPELFARLFDYYIRSKVEESNLSSGEKDILLSETMKEGKDGNIETMDHYILNNFTNKEEVLADFGRLLTFFKTS